MPWKMRHVWERENRSLCILCREPTPTSEEEVKQIKKQMERGNANAFHPMSGLYISMELTVCRKTLQRLMNYV